MLVILSCNQESVSLIQQHMDHIERVVGTDSDYPPLYVKWIDSMVREGSAVFRLYVILTHMLFDEVAKHNLFHGERPEVVLAFTERLQNKLYDALLGRKEDGSKYTAEEIGASRYQRVAEIVCAMQDFYISH